jgi:hypothetical protein
VVKTAASDRPASAQAPPQTTSSRLRAALALTPLAGGLLLLATAVVSGALALQGLRGQGRYQIAFADIDCTPPPHQTREDFLDEVQLIGGLPDSACVLDDGLPARLSVAFAKHPWVERVQRVAVDASRKVHVQLTYRAAVLMIQVPGDRLERPVDRLGVRLPNAAADDALPVLRGDVPPPTGQEGQLWGDDRVQAAARTAALLAPYQDQLTLPILETGPGGGIVLRGIGRRVEWGSAPGSEPLGEAAADEKLRRLLDFAARHSGDAWELDVRPSTP